MLKMFPGVSERLFTVATFSNTLQTIQHYSGTTLQLQQHTDFQQLYPALSVSFFEIIQIFYSECAKRFNSLIVILEKRCSQFGRHSNRTNDL